MLRLVVPLKETFDEETSKFVVTESFVLQLEHSLASLSKWEAKFEKPFLSNTEKTEEESVYYYEECMLQTDNAPPGIFSKLTQKHYDDIQAYINGKHTATWFNDPKNRPRGNRGQIITASVIYGWMVHLRIDFEPAQHWHLNELFTLIRVCNEQQKPPKKMGRAEAARQQAALNEKRLQEMGTRG